MTRQILATAGILFVCISVSAQDSLFFENAVLIALEHNKLIQIAENNKSIADQTSSPGRAGLLPSVNAEGSANYALNNTKIQLQNSSDVIATRGAQQTVMRAGINLNYTIFSGFSNTYRYEFLKQGVVLADHYHRRVAENIILQVASAYFNVLRTEANLEALSASLEISQKRYERAKASFELAGGNSLEMLSAQVDLNQDSTLFLNAQAAVLESLYTLNQLLGQPITTPYNFGNLSDFDEILALDQLINDALSQNSQVMANRVLEEQSMLNYKIAKSAYMPRLNLTSSYTYNNSNTEGSFLRLNQSDGWGNNLSLSIPVFSGGLNTDNVQIEKINLENAKLQTAELESTLERDVRSAYVSYTNAIRIRELEKGNIGTAEKNFEYAEALFQQGSINSVQFREAQINLLLAINSYVNSRFNAKLAELELLRLSGNLLKAFEP